jgi:hypothetical protein
VRLPAEPDGGLGGVGLPALHGFLGRGGGGGPLRFGLAFPPRRAVLVIALLLLGGLFVAKVVRDMVNKQEVAIFSADRKKLQGKQTNVTQRPFKSRKQAGVVNTHRVGATLGPSNPQGV